MAKLTDFTVKVEVATGDTPRTASPTYTDLSAHVRAAAGVSCQRGRSNEFDAQAQPGRASWEFRNTDGRFTVGNASSPYAPVQIRRPCRVRVVYGGVTYPLWQGFIDSWGNSRDELTGVARVEASDRLALAGVTMKSALTADMLRDSPTVLFPLGEPEFSTTAGDVTGAAGIQPLSVTQVGSGGSLDFGAGVAPGPDGGTVAAFTRSDATNGKVLTSSSYYNLNGGWTGFTLEAMVRPSAAQTMSAARAWYGTDGFLYTDIGTSSTGKAQAYIGTGVGIPLTLTGTTTLPTDWFTNVAVIHTAPSGGVVTVRLYVNGVEEAWTTYTRDLVYGYDRLTIGGHSAGSLWDGQISHVAGYISPLSSTRLASHADARAGWDGERSSARFSRLCATYNLPAAQYATGTGASFLGAQPTAGRPLLSALAEIATAESGVVFVSAAGVLTFGVRGDRYNAPVALTLDATKPGQVGDGFALDTDDGLIVNDYTVERPGGATQRVVDGTSVNNYETQAETTTLYVNSDQQALDAAEWLVYTSSEPRPRPGQITVDAVAFINSGGVAADLLGIEIGDRVQITNLPSDVSATSTADLFIEGVRWQIEKDRILAVLTTSPVGAAGAVFVLNDATYGVLNSAAVLAF